LKKKILFIIPNFLNGGSEKALIRTVNNLNSDYYSITILCLKKTGGNADFLKPGINIIDINTPSVYFSIFKIAQAIKSIRPDIVFGWMGYINAYLSFFIPFFSKKINWLCRESGIAGEMNKQHRFPWLFNYLYKTCNRYNTIICQSNYMAKDLVNNFGIQPQKIKIINNSIDFNEIENNKIKTIIKETGKFYLLYVGGLRIEKRVELIIETLATLSKNYLLTIVGSGDQLDKILSSVESYQLGHRVEIISNCYNPVPYYQRTDCLLLASLHEGFPNVVLEAFSCGCPVIGFNIRGGANEALNNYGGFILQNKTIQDFADKIRSVCENEKIEHDEIIRNCKEKYDIKDVIPVYNSLLLQNNDSAKN